MLAGAYVVSVSYYLQLLAAFVLDRLGMQDPMLARTGTTVGHGSGDFAIAFSTTRRIAHEGGETGMPVTHVAALANEGVVLDGLFLAVVEAVEEAVLNSLCAAGTTTGRDGHVRVGIPVDEVGQMLRRTVVRGEAGRIVDG